MEWQSECDVGEVLSEKRSEKGLKASIMAMYEYKNYGLGD